MGQIVLGEGSYVQMLVLRVGENMSEACLYILVRINGQLNLEGVQYQGEATQTAGILQLPPIHPPPFRRPLPYHRQITPPRHSHLIHSHSTHQGDTTPLIFG